MGILDFFPKTNRFGKTWELRKWVCKPKKGKIVKSRMIKNRANYCVLKRPLGVNMKMAKVRCREVRKYYLDNKPNSAEMRECFISEKI